MNTQIPIDFCWRSVSLSIGLSLCSVPLMATNTDSNESNIRVLPFRGTPSLSSPISTAKLTHTSLDPRIKADYVQLSKSLYKQITQIRRQRQIGSSVSSKSTLNPSLAKTDSGHEVQVQWADNGTPRQIKPIHSKRLLKGQAMVATRPTRTNLSKVSQITARQFLKTYQSLLKLDDAANELKLRQVQQDNLGYSHVRFQQFYQGIPVWGQELIVHVDAQGDVALMDGAYSATPAQTITDPVVTAMEAIQFAQQAVTDPLRGILEEKAHLTIYTEQDVPARLAWQVTLSTQLDFRWLVMIDALTGESLLAYNQIQHASANGSGVDLFGTRQPLNLWAANGGYYLIDTSKPMFKPGSDPVQNMTAGAIYVLDAQNKSTSDGNGNVGLPTGKTDIIFNTSTIANTWLSDSVSAAFGLSKTYDYYRERHNRNSLDAQGGSMLAIVRLGNNYKNAFWNGQVMAFGDGLNYAGALDIVAHELTHGVINSTANLVYQNQSGALNEAFADIFGESVEAYYRGRADWINGASLAQKNQRNFHNPSSASFLDNRPYPARMSEFYNFPVDFDQGGVHINSTIITHAFYLLSEGLTTAIGIRDAERIFYRALTVHLTPRAQFFDARLACIQAANELFGINSPQVQRTQEAFNQIEVFAQPATPKPNPLPTIDGADATLSVFRNPANGRFFLRRRELALGDSKQGVGLSHFDIKARKFSVDAAGKTALFVDSVNDLCLIDTQGTRKEDCFGLAGKIHSVASSPDGNQLAVILIENKSTIGIIDLNKPNAAPKIIQLRGFATEGASATIREADSMTFSNDGRFLLYDALNDLSISQGNPVLAWSIYAIDTVTQNILSVVPPVVGLQIGSPALGHTSDDLLAFEAYNPTKQVSTQWAVNLFSGESKPVGTTLGGFGTPVFNGDDSAIIYTQSDQQTGLSTSTGASLVRQALSADHISPNGKATVWMADSMLGYIYRRAVKGSQPTPGNGRTAMGTTRITHNWTLVTLPQAFARPVIIAAPPSFNGSHPGVVRIRNIAPTGYQVRFQEWDYMDGQHTTETLPYLVLEAGHHRMPDGSLWEVGTYSQNGTSIWKAKSFTESFPGQPELFLTIQSTHGAQAVTVRARQITTKGFSSALYEQESLMNGHATETIGYLAIYSPTGSGSITIGGQKHPYTVRKAQVDHRWSSVLNSTIRVHEEQSKDTEVQHLQETLSLLGLGQYLFAQDVSSKGSDPIALRQKPAH